MTRSFIRSSLTRVAALAAGLAMLVAALPPVQAGEPQSRVQVALNRAAETQPRYIPKAPDGVSEFAAVPQLKPIHFAFDRAEVRRSEAAIVDADAAWLRANPDYAILVTGHADERGTTAYNLALGERRAMALRDRLVARGVRADRIVLVSYGEGLPSCRAQGEPCWGTNRAATILVRRTSLQVP
jgi:peptidoglycan-associated lipoprotein